MTLPFPQPMLATLGKPPTRFGDYAVEAKYDGQRGMAVIDSKSVTLLSRNGAVALAVLAAALLVAAISAVVLGFTHAALLIASITAAAVAARRAARLFQLPLV